MACQIVGAGEGGVAFAASDRLDILAADELGLNVTLAMKTEVIEVLEPITTLLALVTLVATRVAQVNGGGLAGFSLDVRGRKTGCVFVVRVGQHGVFILELGRVRRGRGRVGARVILLITSIGFGFVTVVGRE